MGKRRGSGGAAGLLSPAARDALAAIAGSLDHGQAPAEETARAWAADLSAHDFAAVELALNLGARIRLARAIPSPFPPSWIEEANLLYLLGLGILPLCLKTRLSTEAAAAVPGVLPDLIVKIARGQAPDSDEDAVPRLAGELQAQPRQWRRLGIELLAAGIGAGRHRPAAVDLFAPGMPADFLLDLIDKLGGAPTTEVAALLQEVLGLEPGMELRSALKKALYRLREAGVEPPAASRAAAAAPPRPATDTDDVNSAALVSPCMGFGERHVVISAKSRRGEFELLYALVGEASVLRFTAVPVSKQEARHRLRSAEKDLEIRMFKLPVRRALALLEEAHSRAPGKSDHEFVAWRSGRSLGGPEVLAKTVRDIAVGPHHRPIDNPALFFVPPTYLWIPPNEVLDPLGKRLGDIGSGPIILPDSIVRERRREEIRGAAASYFTPERRAIMARQLEESAILLESAGEHERAARAVVTAGSMRQAAPPELPFYEEYLALSLKIRAQEQERAARREEQDRGVVTDLSTDLIVRPGVKPRSPG